MSGLTSRLPSAPRAALLAVSLAVLALLFSAAQVRAGLPVQAAFMVNMSTGRVLYQKNADTPIPPASLTKIMTSFLVHDAIAAGRYNMQTIVQVTPQVAAVGGSTMKLRNGEKVTIEQLLQGALICSGNDAATALALRTSGSLNKFVQAMNAKAANLGMKSTRFRNPTGLPAPGQTTTARDMAKLCLAYLAKYPKVMRIHSQKFFNRGRRTHTTTNPFLGSRGVNGLKTGFTQSSGYNIILTTSHPNNKLLIVVMGGRTKARRESAAASLLQTGIKYPDSPSKIQEIIDGRKPAAKQPAPQQKAAPAKQQPVKQQQKAAPAKQPAPQQKAAPAKQQPAQQKKAAPAQSQTQQTKKTEQKKTGK